MMNTVLIKTKGINFDFIGAEVLEKCPTDASKIFQDGYFYYTQEFFCSLDSLVPILEIDEGVPQEYLDVFIEDPIHYVNFETQNLSSSQKKEFFEGVLLGMEESCNALNLALIPSSSIVIA